jgi:hypothetical protein
MKSRLVLLLIVLFLLALGYIAYAYRYPLAAKIWHWKHGYSTTMGNYEVPVPEHWLILGQNSVALTMLNTSPTRLQRDGKFHTAAVIDIFPFRDRTAEASRMDYWLSLKRQWFAREGVKSIEEKTLKLGDEPITCIGGRELNAILYDKPNHPETDIISLDCMSERGLNILFVGEPSDLQSFYTLVSQIRRRK